MIGPVVVIGRPRSGSRILAGLLRDNGIFMGADLYSESLDSASWYQCFVAPLITSRFFSDWECHASDPDFQALRRQLLEDTWRRFWAQRSPSGRWGWKYCETLFVVPIVKQLFPGARFVHIIRDARDVCLSNRGFFQLTGVPPRDWSPAANSERRPSYSEFCTAVAFGRTGMRRWRGLDLHSPSALVENRYLLQAQSWVTCVEQGRAYGRSHSADYYEIRYEDLCRSPQAEAQKLFQWLDLPCECRIEIETGHVQKWRRTPMSIRERRDFDRAVELAGPLLRALGYAE